MQTPSGPLDPSCDQMSLKIHTPSKLILLRLFLPLHVQLFEGVQISVSDVLSTKVLRYHHLKQGGQGCSANFVCKSNKYSVKPTFNRWTSKNCKKKRSILNIQICLRSMVYLAKYVKLLDQLFTLSNQHDSTLLVLWWNF